MWCERVSPPWGLAQIAPVVLQAWTQRTALAAATPKRSAAPRRDMPLATTAISLERRSIESGLPLHAGLLPSMQGDSHRDRVGEHPSIHTEQFAL